MTLNMALDTLADRYVTFMNQPLIDDFVTHHQGTVFIATEGRRCEEILTLFRAGHRHFSEKYVQEAERKWANLHTIRSECVLHNFGHIQTNKLNKSLHLFDGLESLDCIRLVDKLAFLRSRNLRSRNAAASSCSFYVQFNGATHIRVGRVIFDGVVCASEQLVTQYAGRFH